MIFLNEIPLANKPQSSSMLSVILGILNMEAFNKEGTFAELLGSKMRTHCSIETHKMQSRAIDKY